MSTFMLKADHGVHSKAIIVSFDARWDDLVRNGAVGVVFRKKCPIKYQPECLYAYMSAPISAITARLPIVKIERMSGSAALRLAGLGAISEEELRKYGATVKELFVVWVGPPAVAKRPVTRQTLMAEYGFWPTPNFIAVTDEGRHVLDRLGDFNEGTKR